MTDTSTGKLSIWNTLKTVPHTLRWVQVGDWDTRVLEAGQGNPEALVLMHGTGGHLEAYTHNIAALRRALPRHRLRLPGARLGTTHAKADLELDTYVEHLAGLLDELGIDKAHLNGESLGGWVAIKFAAAHPQRVAKTACSTPQAAPWPHPRSWSASAASRQAAADDPSRRSGSGPGWSG